MFFSEYMYMILSACISIYHGKIIKIYLILFRLEIHLSKSLRVHNFASQTAAMNI